MTPEREIADIEQQLAIAGRYLDAHPFDCRNRAEMDALHAKLDELMACEQCGQPVCDCVRCDGCGSTEALDEYDDSDPSVGYVATVKLCGECAVRK